MKIKIIESKHEVSLSVLFLIHMLFFALGLIVAGFIDWVKICT